jgi:hypothetical protein
MAKKIFINIALLSGLLWILSCITKYVLPFYWGDSTQTIKYEFYKRNCEKYNAVYLGGSLEYRHINPAIIDSTAKANNIDLRSFNLGVDGHGIIQQAEDLDGLLKIRNPNLKYIFLSLSSEPYFFVANMHTSKWVSWQSASSTINAAKILATLKNDNPKKRLKYSGLYAISWIENMFNVSLAPDMISYFVNKNKRDSSYLGKQTNGFYPYDYEEYHLFMEYQWEDTLLLQSRKRYETDNAYRDTMNTEIMRSFVNYKSTDKPNQQMVDLCMKMYNKCAKRGIQVFFMLPPKGRTDYSLLLPVLNAMPKGTQIEIADPRKYPKYYEVAYGYNFHHLNYKGATLQSHEMAKQIVNLMKAEKDSI